MKIYTRTGDKGTTSLVGGTRISKADARLEAYGTADELNSFIGLLRAQGLEAEIDNILHLIQNKLFNIGAILATEPDKQEYLKGMNISDDNITTLEHAIDQLNEQLEPIFQFILPAGNQTVALCHVCRTITRRLERRMVSLNDEITPIDNNCLKFVNRMSDYLFILSKFIAKKEKCEVFLWEK